jgi:hypothetical protein
MSTWALPEPFSGRWSVTNSRPNRWSDLDATRTRRSTVGRSHRSLYSIVHLDVVGSARRESRALRRMRDDLYQLVADVTDDYDLNLETVPFDDIGDALRLVIPLECLRPTRVIDVFVGGLAAGLREHRRQVSSRARIRLRVAFDLGLVGRHRTSWSGDPLIRTARLVDAEPLRQALREDLEVDLAALVSDDMFQTVVQHRFGLIPVRCYREVQVHLKEFEDRAWLLVPRLSCMCNDGGHRHPALPQAIQPDHARAISGPAS